ncbi:hypothetical protein DFJ77DRAFT_465736 [Powellomyces hirtus]|nr:hypothetical protein DFJ77DRAFT_465736 [Powellomyces hirtus]
MARNPFADETPLYDGAESDEPLFLHPTSRDRMIENAIGIGLGLFVALTFIFSIITGFSTSSNNLFMGIALLAFSAVTAQLIGWYRLGDLDPKFKIAILTMGASVLLLAIVANVYFWSPPTINPVCSNMSHGDNGDKDLVPLLYDTLTHTCWYKCPTGQGLDMSVAAPGACKAFAPAP